VVPPITNVAKKGRQDDQVFSKKKRRKGGRGRGIPKGQKPMRNGFFFVFSPIERNPKKGPILGVVPPPLRVFFRMGGCGGTLHDQKMEAGEFRKDIV